MAISLGFAWQILPLILKLQGGYPQCLDSSTARAWQVNTLQVLITSEATAHVDEVAGHIHSGLQSRWRLARGLFNGLAIAPFQDH
jgi:hypothetical protein